MTQSPQGAEFLAARAQFVREFALTRLGKKRMLALLAKYDELLYKAYEPHALGTAWRTVEAIRTKYEKEAPAESLHNPPEASPLAKNIAQRTVLEEALGALANLIKHEPEKSHAAPDDVPAGDRPSDSVG